jgi:hypothetical protein
MKAIYQKIETEAKANTQDVRIIEIVKEDGKSFLKEKDATKKGLVVRQGDINIHLVSAEHEYGKKIKTRQLALGSGKGASHIADTGIEVFEGIKLPAYCESRTFLGPFIRVGKRALIKHGTSANDPERHAYISLPKGFYQVTHQVDPRTKERVAD